MDESLGDTDDLLGQGQYHPRSGWVAACICIWMRGDPPATAGGTDLVQQRILTTLMIEMGIDATAGGTDLVQVQSDL